MWQDRLRRSDFSGIGVAVWLALAQLTGCVTTQPKGLTTRELPVAFRQPSGSAISGATSAMELDQWWTQYGSDELNDLVSRAMRGNAELLGAQQQVLQAKVRLDQVRAGTLPNLTAPIRAVEQSHGSRSDSQNNSQAFVTATYRLDIWGEQEGLYAAAKMQAQRAEHDKLNVQRLTIGGVADTYIAYLSANESLEVARATEVLSRRSLELSEQRLVLGDATVEDVERQRTVLAQHTISVLTLENQIEDLRANLSRLIGELPESIAISANGLENIRIPQATIGVPSQLLLNRPDILSMEDRLRAADANIGVARARMLPPIDLTAQVGYSGTALASLLQPQNLVANAAASLVLAIFDGGARKADGALAQSVYEEMVIAYGKTILQAIREVESALMAMQTARRKLASQTVIAQSAHRILRSGMEAYAAGALDLATLLEYRKNHQRTVDELKKAKAEMLRSHINLSVALGGGLKTHSESSSELADAQPMKTGKASEINARN